MDELDRSILNLLTQDARTPVALIARKLKVARSTAQARLDRLESTGVIAGYRLRLGQGAQGPRLTATVLLEIDLKSQAAILTRLKFIREIESACTTSGRVDLLLTISAPTTQDLDRALDEIGALTGVRNCESLIHLSVKLAPVD